MASDPVVELNGLQLSNNTFSGSPPGSLAIAENVVMPQKGVIEPVRGQARAYTPATAADIPWSLAEFQNAIIANYATSKEDDFGLTVAGGTPFTGDFNPVDFGVDGANMGRMKFGFAGSYLHFCATTGPKALESIAGQPRNAGLLRMPDPFVVMQSASIIASGGSGLAYGSSRAYRTVLRKPTATGVSLLSPPSGRQVITNRLIAAPGKMTRVVATVTVTFPGSSSTSLGLNVSDDFILEPGETNFPAGVYTVASVSGNVITYTDAGAATSNTLTQDFDTLNRPTKLFVPLSTDATEETPVRIYRSRDTSSATTEPSDEMFLVAELFPSGTDIANGFLEYSDTTPGSVINDPLYTNPQTGDGAEQENDAPPLYRDLAYWRDRMWYAQTTQLQTFELQMLGVGLPDGIQDGDTLTITIDTVDYVFTFKDSPGVNDIQIVSNGEPSVNIQQTAQNLIDTANFNVFGPLGDDIEFRLYYNSGQDDAPGKILLQRTGQPTDRLNEEFGVRASRPATWVPALDTSTNVAFSSADYEPNGLAYSKLSQAEAVPPINFTNVGSKNFAIERIIGLQNALLVFKSGDGIYSVTGNFPFQVLQISTANIIARDACVQFADSVWVYTDQGILRVSDSGGATVVSRPIETELNRLRALLPSETRDYSFAVAYETERRVMFFVPFELRDNDLPSLRAWCYCNATQAWTGPLYVNAYSGNVGVVGNRLALGIYDETWSTGRITLERKNLDYTDNADASFSNSVSALIGDNPFLLALSSMTDIAVGDAIAQGSYVTKIAALRPDVGTNYVEVYEEVPWQFSACTIYKGIAYEAQLQPMGSPSSRKALTRLAWLFKPEQYANLGGLSTVLTDQCQAELEVAAPMAGFGLTPFGTGPFGNPSQFVYDVNPIDAKWTNAGEFFVGLKVTEAFTKMKLQGVMLMTDNATGPVGRGPK